MRAAASSPFTSPPTIEALVESAWRYSTVVVEALAHYESPGDDIGQQCRPCQPGDRPVQFGVYLIQSPEGNSEHIADFGHPDEALAWALELGRKTGLPCDVRFDIEAVKAAPLALGDSVIAPLEFNAICGTVESFEDGDAVAILKDCHDLFGPLGRRRIRIYMCRRFWTAPRTLGLGDLIQAAT